jgi:hypothetical protein
MKALLNQIGWYGMAAVFGAYALVSLHVISPTQISYLLLNATGSLALLLETYSKRDLQPAILNLLWLIVALFSLLQLVMK